MHSFILLSLSIFVASVAAGPCDIYAKSGTQCVAAHSLVRALYDSFDGPLYQVTRADTNATFDVTPIKAGGPANAPAQDAFCQDADCFITYIYDQSPSRNHLAVAPGGGAAPNPDRPVNATRLAITLGGSPVYGGYFEGGQGYRNDTTTGMAVNNEAEVLYMVTSGTHFNSGCCFDYGNAETNNLDDNAGAMECVYFGNASGGFGSGPWVMADLENGLFPGNTSYNPNNMPITAEYAFAMVKGGENGFALKGGDATQGTLQTMYDGPRPNGYQPMKKQGAIILGTGGDNSNWDIGTFFEGVITAGYTTDEADDAVFADVVAAGYGQ